MSRAVWILVALLPGPAALLVPSPTADGGEPVKSGDSRSTGGGMSMSMGGGMGMGMDGGGMGGGMGGFMPAAGGTSVVRAPVTVAGQKAREKLDETVELGKVDTTVSELGTLLSDRLEDVSVFLDQRGLRLAGVSDNTAVKADLPSARLRATMRRLLHPLALQAVVSEDGLLITADHGVLAQRGIGTDRWIGISEDFAERVE